MIDHATTKKGDKLRITGVGAPGFSKIGDIVTVIECNSINKLYVMNEAGDKAFFYYGLLCRAS